MTNEPVQKKVNLTVNGVADVQGNRGPQWEIQIQYYFSKFPTKQWVDNDGTNDKPAVGQTYPCIIQRGELSSDRDGKVYDGSAEWMYRWRIVEFNTGGEPWSNPAGPQATRTPSVTPRRKGPRLSRYSRSRHGTATTASSAV